MASYRGRALALLKGPMLLMLMLSPRRWRSRAGSGMWLCCSAILARVSARGRSRTTCAAAASPSWTDIRIACQDIDRGISSRAASALVHDRVLRRVQVEADDVADLGLELRVGGELERPPPPRLHPVGAPGPRDGRVTDPKMAAQQS